MNTDTLKNKITQANLAYRAGTSDDIVADYDYDALVDELRHALPEDEFNYFLNSLHEVEGKYTHPYIMGSLSKVKAEEPAAVFAFLRKHLPSKVLHISAKIDGVSCRLHYENGKLVGAFTRGDGTAGQNISDKIIHVNNVPWTISNTDTIDIRGELVIYKEAFATIADSFKNARNACAGILNQLKADKRLLKKVSFVAYEIMGGKYTKSEQFTMLENLKFTIAYWCQYVTDFTKLDDRSISLLIDVAKQEFPYETDGLVLSDPTYKAENVYRPVAQIAFKVNDISASTIIRDIDWRGPSKDGKYVPVAIIEPISLGGSTISAVTCHNLDYIDKLGLQIGSTVEIIKSGDVIPKITKLLTNDTASAPIVRPSVCAVCNNTLIVSGCDLVCDNPECSDKESFAVANFIRKLGIEYAAKRSLINWNITTFDALLKFGRTLDSASKNKFYDQLEQKLFNISSIDIFKNLNFHGLNAKSVGKLIEYYGFTNLRNKNFEKGYPAGIGQTLIDKFCETSDDNFKILDAITLDERYSFTPTNELKTTTPTRGSVCFTGALDTMTRPVAEAKAVAMGWTIGSVNKNLTVLVCNDLTSTSNKIEKAKLLGIKIMNEHDFFNV